MKRNKRRDELATIAMHGILTACDSPQFYDRIADTAHKEKTSVPRVIAHQAYHLANAMMLEGGK